MKTMFRNVWIHTSACPLSLRARTCAFFVSQNPLGVHQYFCQPFDEMPERDVVSWTSTISYLAKGMRKAQAFLSFKSMLQLGIMPNYVTVVCAFGALNGISGFAETKRAMHCLVIKSGFRSEPSVVTALLGFYSHFEDMGESLRVFDDAPVKDLILCSAMVAVLSKNKHYAEAFNLFREMQDFGLVPNDVTIIGVLPACGNSRALLLGKQIHAYSIKHEFYSETNIQNALIDFYLKFEKFDSSMNIFHRIPKMDMISWRTIICGSVQNGMFVTAVKFFLKMRRSCFNPDITIIHNVINAVSQTNNVEIGLSLHCYIIKSCFSDSITINTSLVRMYADVGEVNKAGDLFNQMCRRDLIAWSAMISVYAKGNDPVLALETFRKMAVANVEGNEITFVSLIQACASMAAQEHGKSIHAYVVRAGYICNAHVVSSLIDFYCKVGKLREGEILFGRLEQKDTVCWSSMIHGYGINGCGEEAIETFSEMLDQGLEPNEVTFLSVLSACSHCGLMDEGWRWFYSMEDKYGLHPKLAHYSCMVDMLSRQGRIKEAIKFLYGMPVEPDAKIWGALFAGCRMRDEDVGVAETAAKHLLRLDPKNSSYYVAVSNMYAEFGKWSDVERVREFIENGDVGKNVGFSML